MAGTPTLPISGVSEEISKEITSFQAVKAAVQPVMTGVLPCQV